jgi:nucleoside-diphosphate-sugar epimerase
MKKKILVVGGAGYLGGPVVDILLQAHHEVRVFDNLTYEDTYLKDVDFYFGDITEFNSLKELFNWADAVIWLSALVGDPACALNPKLTMDINVESIKSLVKNFSGRIVFPSTCSVYGASDDLLTETSQLNPLSIYAESKIQAEKVLLDSGLPVIIFRLGTLYGKGDNFSRLRADLVLNTLTIRAVIEKVMTVFGGKQYRPMLHVKDAAQAICNSVNQDAVGLYNLHSENVTIIEIAHRVQSIIKKSSIEISETNFQDNRNYKVSSDLAIEKLAFSPERNLEVGINEIQNLVDSKRIPNVGLSKFSNHLSLIMNKKGD